MGNKKDIGLAIKEKLIHLDKSPKDNVWEAIQSDLDKKKKRRMIPFWFSYIGIFSVGILASYIIFNKSFKQNNLIILKENSITINKKKNLNLNNTENINKKLNSNDSVLNFKNTNIRKKEKLISNYKVIESKLITKTNSKSNSRKKVATKNSSFTHGKKIFSKTKKLYSFKGRVISTNEKKSNNTFDINFLSKEFTSTDNKNSIENITISSKTNSKDSIVKKKTINGVTKKDSLTKAIDKVKSFTIFIYGGPTKSLFLNKNSSLDNRLNSNCKKSEISFNYGAYLCYYGSKNLSLRIGIEKNSSKIITQNAFVNTLNYSNIEYSNNYSNTEIYNQSNNSEYMNITQDISYIEIPLEAKYKFLDTKIGINAILGINYLLLDKNEVSVNTENGFNALIGKTSNLLSYSFGANIGFGFDYQISKNIKFNFEPMFKYQLKNNQENINTNLLNFNILTGIEIILFNR